MDCRDAAREYKGGIVYNAREHLQSCSSCITREHSSPISIQGSTASSAPHHTTREHGHQCSPTTQTKGAQPTVLPQVYKGAQPAGLPHTCCTREHSLQCSPANPTQGSTANGAPQPAQGSTASWAPGALQGSTVHACSPTSCTREHSQPCS